VLSTRRRMVANVGVRAMDARCHARESSDLGAKRSRNSVESLVVVVDTSTTTSKWSTLSSNQ